MQKYDQSPELKKLLMMLEDFSYSEKLMFGQQNAGHIGVSIEEKDGTDSDCKRVCGKMPAIVGIDTLSFLGYEGKMEDLIKIVKNLHKAGCIITLSAHMPNFALGGDDFYDYSPNNAEGDPAHRIMPCGDLNGKYLRFLDMIVDFATRCVDVEGNKIPMIFRPFHEDNGDWFWWGRKYLDDMDYVRLFRYTVDYISGWKGIDSLAYCYSPNGFISSGEYMKRYPGDDVIDIMGLDLYHDSPKKNDAFYRKLADQLDDIFQLSQLHGKLTALTETGYRSLDTAGGHFEGLSPSGNTVKTWFTDMLKTINFCEGGQRLAYMLIWANFSDQQFWLPYIKGEFRHEMCDDFMDFILDPHIVMAPVLGIDSIV